MIGQDSGVVKCKQTQGLVELMAKDLVSDEHWASEVLSESDRVGLGFDDTLSQILRFRSLVTNFLEGCPYEFVDDIYCGRVISSALKSHCSKSVENMKGLLNCVQKQGLVTLLINCADDLSIKIAEAATPIQTSWLAVALIKAELDSQQTDDFMKAILARPCSQMVQQLDKQIIQLKHCNTRIADRFLAAFKNNLGGIRMQVLRATLKFWSSPNFVRIGSSKQQLYVTYLAYHMLLLCGSDVFEKDLELFESLREGIQERITKVGTVSEAGYH